MSNEPELPRFLAHPTKADLWLLAGFFAVFIYSLVMIPLRAYLLSHPLAYTLLVGGYTSAVISGANVSVGAGQWWVFLLCTVFGAVKFMPLYWAIGRQWGTDFIELSVQYMPRIKGFLRRVLGNPSKKSTALICLLIPLSFAPGPVPGNVSNAVLGLIKVPFSAMLALNAASVAVINGIFMWLGFTFGEQVLNVVDVVNKYLLWFTLALIAVMIFRAWRQAKAGKEVADDA